MYSTLLHCTKSDTPPSQYEKPARLQKRITECDSGSLGMYVKYADASQMGPFLSEEYCTKKEQQRQTECENEEQTEITSHFRIRFVRLQEIR